MSEVKLNLIDSQETLHGTIHGSVADACVAALSAEPETIAELSAALARYIKPLDDWGPFATFRSSAHSSDQSPLHPWLSNSANPRLDTEPWDAGIVVIDLAARIVACESTYSMPEPSGEVQYHDGTASTEIPVPYRLPDDWLFVNSVEAYQWSRERRREDRLAKTPLDVRKVLYGAPLLDFILTECGNIEISVPGPNGDHSVPGASVTVADTYNSAADAAGLIVNASDATADTFNSTPNTVDGIADVSAASADAGGSIADNSDSAADASDAIEEALSRELSRIHAHWLMTPREDLRGQSPRDVILAKQDFIDSDLDTRSLQWSLLDEGPPCLSPDSFAYRFAGFGTHEWVIYYDLVRHLLWTAATLWSASTLWSAPTCRSFGRGDLSPHASHKTLTQQNNETLQDRDALITELETLKSAWLEHPHPDYDNRIPAILIDNERKRLPIALRPRDMIIDEDCPMCQMFGDETSLLGMGVGFWHLDGCNMDDDFAFSPYKTREEWEAENVRREEFDKEFKRRMEERKQRIARGEVLEHDPFFDPDPREWEFADSTLVSGESIDDDEKEFPQ